MNFMTQVESMLRLQQMKFRGSLQVQIFIMMEVQLQLPLVTQDADDTGVDGDYTWYKWTDTTGTGSYNTDNAYTKHIHG